LLELHKRVSTSEDPQDAYQRKDGVIYYKGHVVIPPGSPLISLLLVKLHDSKFGGQLGVLRTHKRLPQAFYWPLMQKDVEQHISECDVCQKEKYDAQTPAGRLQPLLVPSQVWEDISMNFVDGLLPSAGKNTIMVVVDQLTKYAHFIALTHS
jgi:hypothetical protein